MNGPIGAGEVTRTVADACWSCGSVHRLEVAAHSARLRDVQWHCAPCDVHWRAPGRPVAGVQPAT